MKEAAYGLEFWGRKFGLRSKCGVTFCLLGNAQKGLRQIFKLGPNCLVAFGFGFGKKLSGLRATIIRRRHSRRHVVLRIILVQCSVALNRSGKISKQAAANFKLGPRGVKIGQHHSRCVNIIPPPHHTAAPGFWAGFDFGKQAPVAAHNNCFAREPAARNF